MEYYIIYNGKQIGPLTKEQLLNYGLNPNSEVWCPGMPQWVPAYTLPELMELINSHPGSVPPPHPQGNDITSTGTSGKSRLAFALFAFLLGGLGAQYFYVGKFGGAILCILLTIITCGVWEIVLLVQAILALTMTQETFEDKYVYSTSTMPLF